MDEIIHVDRIRTEYLFDCLLLIIWLFMKIRRDVEVSNYIDL